MFCSRLWKDRHGVSYISPKLPTLSHEHSVRSLIVEHLRYSLANQSNVGIVPIYCEYQLKELQTPESLLASLWRELSHSHDTIAGEVKDLYTKHSRYHTKPDMNEIVSVVLAEICKHSIVFVVVDALDECPEDGRVRARFIEKLQHILTSTNSTETKVRLLIASRLTKVLLDANEIEVRASDDDIERLVCQRIGEGLSDDDEISQSVRQNDTLKGTLAATIIEKARNMYLYLESTSVMADCTDRYCRFLIAKLQLDSLATKTTLRNLREAIQCDPKDLDELYIEAWSRVNDQNRDSRHDAKKALCWLSCSFRQLRVQELQQALATREGDKAIDEESLVNFDRLVRSCAGLVTVDKGSQIVRLVHQTAQDFLGARVAEYFQDAHTRLTETCLTYLLFDEFSQGPCEFESNKLSTYPHLRGPIAASRFVYTRLRRNPFMQYAARYWGHHARGEATERALKRKILAFLNTPGALASTVQVQYRDFVLLLGLARSLDSSKHTPIHVVVSFALEHILEALLETVAAEDLNVEDQRKKTAFHWAVELGLDVCARTLLAAGADIWTEDNRGCTALYKASALGHASIVKMILEQDNGAMLKKKEVRRAVLSNQMLVIKTYIQAAPRPAERANLMLMESSLLDKPDIIALAMSFGADVNVEGRRGCTPLLVAVENGRSAAAEALVAAGASTAVLQASGKTLLQVATFSQNIFKERVELMKKINEACKGRLLRRHEASWLHEVQWDQLGIANELHRDFFQRFSYWYEDKNLDPAADSNLETAILEDREHPGIIRLLLSHGADPRVKTSEGETVLHLAIGSAPRVKVLLELVPVLDINAQDGQGRSALHHAAASGNHAAMEVLLANGANINMRDIGGASALHYAVNHPNCVQIAIQHGISMAVVDSWKRTILHYLVMMKSTRWEVVELFLKAGIGLDTVDSQGKTATDYYKKCHTGPHGFEQTISWIDTQLEERYALPEAALFRTLREDRARAEENLKWAKNRYRVR